jgi:hypothetical protein
MMIPDYCEWIESYPISPDCELLAQQKAERCKDRERTCKLNTLFNTRRGKARKQNTVW